MLLTCETCQARVDAKEIGGYDERGVALTLEHDVRLLRCPECQSPFLIRRDYDCMGSTYTVTVLYPRSDVPDTRELPQVIARNFHEALRCARAKAYAATVMMARKTIEALCHHFEHSKGNLAASLKAMRDAEVIDPTMLQWAEALRLAGNEAAHEVATEVDQQDAADVLNFLHAILEYTFTDRAKFDAYMERKRGEESG